MNVATFTQDKLHGTFPEEFLNFVKGKPNVKLADAAKFFENAMSIKTPLEQVLIFNRLNS